jgi:hypothetical protein
VRICRSRSRLCSLALEDLAPCGLVPLDLLQLKNRVELTHPLPDEGTEVTKPLLFGWVVGGQLDQAPLHRIRGLYRLMIMLEIIGIFGDDVTALGRLGQGDFPPQLLELSKNHLGMLDPERPVAQLPYAEVCTQGHGGQTSQRNRKSGIDLALCGSFAARAGVTTLIPEASCFSAQHFFGPSPYEA